MLRVGSTEQDFEYAVAMHKSLLPFQSLIGILSEFYMTTFVYSKNPSLTQALAKDENSELLSLLGRAYK